MKHKVLLELIAAEQFGGFDPGLETEMLGLHSLLHQRPGAVAKPMISPRIPILLLDLPVLTPTLWGRAWGDVMGGGIFMLDNF